MNLAAPKPMTLAEFLKWEERQDLRYEFDGSAPVAMAGGSLAHAAIQRNLALALGSRLRGKPCQFFGSAESPASSSAATSRSRRRKTAVATRTEW
jgi:hypothetical protein